jgi:hypothetical protein
MAALFFMTFGKTASNILVLRLCNFPLKESLIISVWLGHIGEFSFLFSSAAIKIHLIGEYRVRFLISLTALNLFLSPFWLVFAERCRSLAKNVVVASTWEYFQFAIHREMIKIEKWKVSIGVFAPCRKRTKFRLPLLISNFMRKLKWQLPENPPKERNSDNFSETYFSLRKLTGIAYTFNIRNRSS